MAATTPTAATTSIAATIPTAATTSIAATIPTAATTSIAATIPTAATTSIAATIPRATTILTAATTSTAAATLSAATTAMAATTSIAATIPTAATTSTAAATPTAATIPIAATTPTAAGTATITIQSEIHTHIENLLQTAYDFFQQTLQLYDVTQLIFCFNGGKDCTVLLDLFMGYCRLHGIDSRQIPLLYIESDDTFEQIDDFVGMCSKRYELNLIKYEDTLKLALAHMTKDMPHIKAVFVGSRNTDPYCEHLQPMHQTDSDWPVIMRLNPLLEWSYHDIWHYIHIYKVPYCSLYAQGYTSIGYKSNTLPNPHLECGSCSGHVCYKPAWELVDPTKERAGRLSR